MRYPKLARNLLIIRTMNVNVITLLWRFNELWLIIARRTRPLILVCLRSSGGYVKFDLFLSGLLNYYKIRSHYVFRELNSNFIFVWIILKETRYGLFSLYRRWNDVKMTLFEIRCCWNHALFFGLLVLYRRAEVNLKLVAVFFLNVLCQHSPPLLEWKTFVIIIHLRFDLSVIFLIFLLLLILAWFLKALFTYDELLIRVAAMIVVSL